MKLVDYLRRISNTHALKQNPAEREISMIFSFFVDGISV